MRCLSWTCLQVLDILAEPGSRAVGPVQLLAGRERKPVEIEERLPYVAVLIAPPLPAGVTSDSAGE